MLFSEKEACTPHGQSPTIYDSTLENCSSASDVCYLREDILLSWMKDQVDTGNWMKGKLFCPSCNCRIGSFNFVGGSKCNCGLSVLPSLHVVAHKLDREIKIASHVPPQESKTEMQVDV
ncbi:hypothetical protein AVEN_59588-1 [Araneus ventricosus]|uniref:E3 ubiquitin-protein ligase RNF180 n=1 Tax=Araneus ventricosus TaxID=182803 RepID=A0A4Y2RPR7_ARAVE|nr:hypothetical protein AVEN_59588-1 [Araneus ventricosus]